LLREIGLITDTTRALLEKDFETPLSWWWFVHNRTFLVITASLLCYLEALIPFENRFISLPNIIHVFWIERYELRKLNPQVHHQLQ